MGNTSCTDALYVDESKKSDYLLIAVSVPQQHLSHIKKVLKSLLLPGQKRIHMKNEKDSRRRMIVRNILTHMPRDFRVTVYCCPKNAGYKQIKMRKLCIENMAWHQKDSTSTIILESDATMDRQDKQQLYNLFRICRIPSHGICINGRKRIYCSVFRILLAGVYSVVGIGDSVFRCYL